MSIPKSNKPGIIAFAVDKGGVGKTTTCLNTAAGLANLGNHVLMVDTDQQANLTSTFLKDEPTHSLLESLCDESTPLPIVKVRENLDLVPATNRMFGIGLKLIVEMTRSMMNGKPSPDCRGILKRLLDSVRNKYDYILIDCPPSDNIMMMNALYAANSVVIVAKPEPYCVRGVQNFVNMMWVVKRDANPSLRLAGILITDYFADATGHRNGEAALRAWAPKFVFSTQIRHSRPLYNAILAHQDIFSYAPDSNGAQDYADFVYELISRNL